MILNSWAGRSAHCWVVRRARRASGRSRLWDFSFLRSSISVTEQNTHPGNKTSLSWEVLCSAWAGCEPPAAWAHANIPSLMLLFCKEQHSEWWDTSAGWEKRGGNSRSGPLFFLFPVCLYLGSRHSPPCCLSAPDSNRSSTGFLPCFGRLNLHSHCLCLSNLQVDIY